MCMNTFIFKNFNYFFFGTELEENPELKNCKYFKTPAVC